MNALAPIGVVLIVAIGFAALAFIAERRAKRHAHEPSTGEFDQLPFDGGVLGHVGQDWIDWTAIEWWPDGLLLGPTLEEEEHDG